MKTRQKVGIGLCGAAALGGLVWFSIKQGESGCGDGADRRKWRRWTRLVSAGDRHRVK